ncbi:MAG: hypothetical protein Q8M15_10865 [Bacteroidota bacterium]|nr:hypothetical protein [Bacteroidota bacterium]
MRESRGVAPSEEASGLQPEGDLLGGMARGAAPGYDAAGFQPEEYISMLVAICLRRHREKA